MRVDRVIELQKFLSVDLLISHMATNSDTPWQPLTVTEVGSLFSEADFPWWIAGGYAIEFAVGHSFRPHADIDVLLLRKDQLLAHKTLAGWDCWAADPPGTLRPWRPGEVLPGHVSDVWCREDPKDPWRLQLMLDDGDERHWRSRRNGLVTRPIDEVGLRSPEGMPFLAPEIQLFYKAKAPRPKDWLDFTKVLPVLSHSQKTWLEDAILTAYGQDNGLLTELRQRIP
jgi:hypothetical protein